MTTSFRGSSDSLERTATINPTPLQTFAPMVMGRTSPALQLVPLQALRVACLHCKPLHYRHLVLLHFLHNSHTFSNTKKSISSNHRATPAYVFL